MRRLCSADGQLFELSDAASEQSVMLQGDDARDGHVLVKDLDAERLASVTELLERTASLVASAPENRRPELLKDGLPRAAALDDEVRAAALALVQQNVTGLADAAALLRDLRFLDCPLPASILAEHVAQLLRGQSADALRIQLGAPDDLSDGKKNAARAEPLFTPHDPASGHAELLFTPHDSASPNVLAPPQPARSISLTMDMGIPDEGNMQACLERCDARTLREIKAVSASWQRRVRETLNSAGSVWRQSPIWSASDRGRDLATKLAATDIHHYPTSQTYVTSL